MSFINRTEDYHREEGGERHVRTVSENCWVSVLHRRTGFGWMEWETAICMTFKADDLEVRRHVKGSPFIVQGDWRKELETMPESELMAWYHSKREDKPTTFDAVIDQIKASEVTQ